MQKCSTAASSSTTHHHRPSPCITRTAAHLFNLLVQAHPHTCSGGGGADECIGSPVLRHHLLQVPLCTRGLHSNSKLNCAHPHCFQNLNSQRSRRCSPARMEPI